MSITILEVIAFVAFALAACCAFMAWKSKPATIVRQTEPMLYLDND